MALTPETTDALKQALTAVIDEAGDDPAHADLVESLRAASETLDAPDHGESPADAADESPADESPAEDAKDAPADPPADNEPDDGPPESFAGAEKALAERMKRKREARA